LAHMPGIMISCFDRTTIMAQPWADAGYLCYCVDIQHPKGETREGNIIKVGADMMDWLPPKGNIVFAAFFPPCTDIAVSGARWFRDKGLGALIRALQLFKRSVDLAELIGAPYMIENPVSTVSTYWRPPDYKFQPWMYGENYSKETWLWAGNGFRMPRPDEVHPPENLEQKIWLMPPSPDRADKRAETSEKFARAVFKANAPGIRPACF